MRNFLTILALCLSAVMAAQSPMPTYMAPARTISGGTINPDTVIADKGIFDTLIVNGPFDMPNQSTGYLVKTPSDTTIESLQCAVTDVAGWNGGAVTSLFATMAGPSKIASGGTSGYIQTTTNGVDYLFPTKPNTNLIFSGTYGLSRYVFVGTTTADSVTGSTSTDGVTWASMKANFTSGNVGAIACNGTNCVLVGNLSRVQTTTNFTTFTTRTYGGVSTTINGVAWSPTLTMFAAVGTTGAIRTSSDSGVTWTARTSGVATPLYGISWSVTNSMFVAVGSAGVILTSTDGIVWTPRTSGVSASLYNANEGNGVLVVTGDSLKIITSTNGTSWTVRSTGNPSTDELYQSAYLGGVYLVAGQNGVTFTSPNATTWTRAGVVAPGCVDKSQMISEYLANTTAKTINGGLTVDSAKVSGRAYIGTTSQPFSGSTPQLLVVNTTDGSVMFTDNVTNATNKYFRLLLAPRTNSATANMVLEAENGASSFLVNLGGGISGSYAATNGQFWAAANNTTTTGTNVGGWDVNGIRATTLGVSGIGTRISAFANTPYLGYNAMYDVADSRYEYGLNSSSQYAAYSQLNASTGAWSLNISTSAGSAAGAITSAAVITAVPTGTVTIGGATPIITMLAGDLKSGVNTSNVRVMGGNSSSDGGYILYGGNARAGDRMQYVLPSTWSAGTNAHVFYVNASIEGLRIQAVGSSGSVSGSTVTIPSLAGTGTRTVVADANGVLSAP